MLRKLLVLLSGFALLEMVPSAGADSPARTLSAAGKVVGTDGKPVAGATVYLREWAFVRKAHPSDQAVNDILARTTTDDQGAFAFRKVPLPQPYLDEVPRGAPCPWDVVVTAKGHGLAWERLTSASGHRPLQLTLPPSAKVRGRLVDPEGKPVAGARVELLRVQALDHPLQANVTTDDNLNLEGSRLPRAASSDGEGRFVLDRLPREVRTTLAVVDERFLRHTVCAATTNQPQPNVVVGRGLTPQGAITVQEEPVHTAEFTVTLRPGHRLRVRVVGAATGKAVAGARIKQFLGPAAFPAGPPADADGWLSFSPLPPGKYMLEVRPPDQSDYLGVFLPLTIPAEKPEVEATASLPSGVAVTGRVVEAETGKAIAGVTVTHQAQADSRRQPRMLTPTARTGPDGRFRIVVRPGKGRLQVAGDVPGYVRTDFVPNPRRELEGRSVLQVEVPPGQPLSGVQLTLTRGSVTVVRVLDPEGKAVPGARAFGFASDAEGRLTLTGLDPQKTRDLIITHPDRRLAAQVAIPTPKDKETLSLEVKLHSAGSVAGRALGTEDKPLPRASVQLMKLTSPAGQTKVFAPVPVAPIPADRDGRFQLDNLVPGLEYTVAVTARGYATAYGVPFEARPGAVHPLPDVLLPRADQAVGGVVVDPRGKPVVGVQVNGVPLRPAAIEHSVRVGDKMTVTDTEGRFHLTGFPQGAVLLTAFLLPPSTAPDRAVRTRATVRAEAGRTDVRIVLTGPQTEKPAEAVTGKPAPEFPVRRWVQRAGAPTGRGFTREDFRDRVVVLAFLDDAKSSQRLLPRLNRLHERLAGKGVAVVRVYELEEPKEELSKLSPTPAALVTPGLVPGGYSEAFQKYGARATPVLFLIDRRGVLRHADVEPDVLEARLEELLKP